MHPNHILILLLVYLAGLSGMASYLDAQRIVEPQWFVMGTSIAGPLAAAAGPSSTDSSKRWPVPPEMVPYVTNIRSAIEKHMVYPRNHAGKRCTARVEQDKSGKVVRLQIMQCASQELQRSVERAILRASPLPQHPENAFFERNLVLQFIVPKES